MGKISKLLSNLKLTLDSSGKVLTLIDVSTGKVLMVNDGENVHPLLPGGELSFAPDRFIPRCDEEDEYDYQYGDWND